MSLVSILKNANHFLFKDVLPPEPPRPMSPRLAAELERLREQEEAREAEKARKAAQGESDSENSFDEDEPDARQHKPKKLKSRFFLHLIFISSFSLLLGLDQHNGVNLSVWQNSRYMMSCLKGP